MDLKNNTVAFKGISEGLLWALPVIEASHQRWTGRGAVITSLNDGRHMRGSKHYTGDAVDLRVWYTGDDTAEWAEYLKTELGPDYDVVYGDPQHLDHIHLEFDPKS